MLPRRVFASVALVAALTLPTACRDTPVAPGGGDPDPDATVGQVRLLATKESLEETELLLLRADVISVSGRLLRDVPVTWSSGDTAVARVDSAGRLLGVGPGEVTIRAAASGVEGARRFAVLGPDSLHLDVPGAVAPGDTIRLAVRAFTPSGRSCDSGTVRWLSGDTSVATVDVTGLLRAHRPGLGTVTVQARGLTATAAVPVEGAALIRLHTGMISLGVGGTAAVGAVALTASGDTLRGVQFLWSTEDAAIAVVEGPGVLRGVAVGTTRIAASAHGLSAWAQVDVRGPDRIVLSRAEATLMEGDSLRLRAVALTDYGDTVPGALISWSSSDAAVADVDATGLVHARAHGLAEIAATSGTLRESAAVRVIREGVCEPVGTLHTGAAADTVWRVADNPHTLQGTTRVPRLRIEPGVAVCVKTGGGLEVQRLDARGTPDLPIRFFSNAGTGGWSGVRISSGSYPVSGAPTSYLEHVRIEDADVAIRAEHPVEMRSVAVLRTASDGVVLSSGTVRELTVDSAGGTGVRVLSYNDPGLTLDAPRVRWSGGMGIYLSRRSSLTLVGAEILGSGGTGLHQDSEAFTLRVREGVRISGGSSYPANVYSSVLSGLLPDTSSHAALTGNARDTLLVMGNGSGPLVIRPELPWVAQGGLSGVWAHLGRVHLLPGAFLRVGNGTLQVGLTSSATAAAPATVQGEPNWTPTLVVHGDGQPLRHVVFRWLAVTGEADWPSNAPPPVAPLHLADVTVTDGRVELEPANSTVVNALLTRTQLLLGEGASARQVQVRDAPADGVLVRGAGAVLTDCVVSGSGGHGVRVDSGTVRVDQCNLEGNAGAGINNLTADTVDARGNWWGDAAGPLGPLGDGVLGPVNYLPFLGVPVTFTPVLAPVTFTAVLAPAGSRRF